MGKVTLVGAGPYDVGLLTLKGYHALKEADVLVYDRLLNTEFLNMVKETCEKINVGKAKNNHPVSQTEINQILLTKALEDKNVVRLKGGDPYVFGRGSEELELLRAHHVPFEVIPGITAAVSVPSYAGIPVTARDCASSVHIITGHKKEGEPLDIAFDALVKLGGTCVFMMSLYNLSQICAGLLAAGMAAHTPAALIENGTSSKQRKFVADLSNIEQVAKDNNVLSPTVFVVGDVCQLSERYDWFDRLPLHQTKVVVTSHKGADETMAQKLRALGADVVTYPCIKTIPMQEEIDQFFCDVKALASYEWVVFTSKQGVKYFFDGMKQHKIDVRALCGMHVAAVGPETEKELIERGIMADYVPECYHADALATGLVGKVTGQVLLARAKNGAKGLTELFDQNKICYKELPLYETISVQPEPICIEDVDYVAFKSASAVHGFVQSIEKDKRSTINGICIGEQTAQAASAYGIRTFVAHTATIDGMVELIKEQKQNEYTSEKNEGQ